MGRAMKDTLVALSLMHNAVPCVLSSCQTNTHSYTIKTATKREKNSGVGSRAFHRNKVNFKFKHKICIKSKSNQQRHRQTLCGVVKRLLDLAWYCHIFVTLKDNENANLKKTNKHNLNLSPLHVRLYWSRHKMPVRANGNISVS